jgi:SAM-dependent methyltransferase
LKISRRVFQSLLALLFISVAGAAAVLAQDAREAPKPFEPIVGQEGKDVVWVPTPQALVDKMLDLAKVTPRDYVMDLGSGDGRNIIAAAKRGARALGVEYNPDMVELSRRTAEQEGVADKALFVQGDMFAADISEATVMALFLLPDNLEKLTPKFVDLKPGTRMVLNGFAVPGWDPDVTERAEGDCGSWCTAMLYIVPARVDGAWRLGNGELKIEQKFQKFTGTLTRGGSAAAIKDGRLNGDDIAFTAGGVQYAGRVNGNAIQGAGGTWRATRVRPGTP